MDTPSGTHTNWYEPPTYPGGDAPDDKYKDAGEDVVTWCALNNASTTRTWSRTKTCYVKKPGTNDSNIAGGSWATKAEHLHLIECPNGSQYGATLPVYRSDTGANLGYTKAAHSLSTTASTTKPQCDAVLNITNWVAGTDSGTAAKSS